MYAVSAADDVALFDDEVVIVVMLVVGLVLVLQFTTVGDSSAVVF